MFECSYCDTLYIKYPLIYEKKSDKKESSLRSLEFYREVEKDPKLYTNLPKEDKIWFLIGLRDLFVATCKDILDKAERDLLLKMVDLVDDQGEEPLVSKKINNIEATPSPTSRNKLVRFIDMPDSETMIDQCFICNELNFLIVFVDPRELSYHNIENIINLDSLFDVQDKFKITNLKKIPDYDIYTFDMLDKSNKLLPLDKYGFYVQPLNKDSRGGERFIFQSETLSKSLTSCIKKYIKDKDLITPKFRFVNYVFRYNKFKPNDRKFFSHYKLYCFAHPLAEKV